MQEPMDTYKPLKKQATNKPTRKIGRGGVGGALAIVGIALLDAAGIQVTSTLAAAIGTLVTSGVGYFTRDRA